VDWCLLDTSPPHLFFFPPPPRGPSERTTTSEYRSGNPTNQRPPSGIPQRVGDRQDSSPQQRPQVPHRPGEGGHRVPSLAGRD